MKTEHSTDDLQDAVLLLEPSRREAPGIEDAARATCSYGLLLAIPVALIVAAFALLARLAPALPVFRAAW